VIDSPCQKKCELVSDSCKSCKRTLQEITEWSRYSDAHRELIIKAMYYVAGSDGHLDDRESELLMHTAKVLEMTPAHIKGVLSELDKGANN